jgi:hypothetical protein
MLPDMELKRPFSDDDWNTTPEPVKQYIVALEQTISQLIKRVEVLEKRTEKLENKTNQNSQKSPVSHHQLIIHLKSQRKNIKRAN